MKRCIYCLAAAAALLPAAWAQAQGRAQPYGEISYSYLEAALTAHRIDTTLVGEEEALGAGFKASYEVMPYMHVFGSYQFTDFDDFDLQTNLIKIGVGAHYSISATKSVYADVAAIATDLELTDPVFGSVNADDDGYGVSIGYREVNHTPLEFHLSVDYVAFDKADTSETTADIGLQYAINRQLKILGAIQFGGDENILRLGARYYLGGRNAN
jgi:hypothetical protein